MAEETIYCPSCNHKLRVPEEMLGQSVQCPLCRVVFVAPTRGGPGPALPPLVLPAAPAPAPSVPASPAPRPPRFVSEGGTEDDPDLALVMVRPPAMNLLWIGILGWVLNAFGALQTKLRGVNGMAETLETHRRSMPEFPPGPEKEMMDKMMTAEFQYYFQIGFGLLFMVLCTFIIIGAAGMLRLRHYRLAILGCFLAMVNLNNFCCLAGVPIGIWALTVLMRPDVRRAFES